MVGVNTNDFFDSFNDDEARIGIQIERRDQMFQTYVRNHYTAHLQEIMLTLKNEYTNWEEPLQLPTSVRNQAI